MAAPARQAAPGSRAGERWAQVALLGLILAVGLAAYWPVLGLNFFWEDPFDIGQVEAFSYRQLLAVPNSNSYYRPLALVALKALKLGGDVYRPAPYHAFVVAGHLLSAGLLFGLAHHLFQRKALALAAGLLYVLFPVAYEATARAPSMHHWLTAATFASLWLYAWGRQAGRRWPIVAALLIMALAQTLHENGLSFAALALLLELWLAWQRRVPRFDPLVFVFFLPAILYLALWFSIPKSGEPPSLGLHPREALYLSQGLSFPIGGVISRGGGFGLSAEWQAALALGLAGAALGAAHGRRGWPRLALALAWWAAASSLAWLARPIEYLQVSPRVMYYPSFGSALAWAGMLDLGMSGLAARPWRRWIGVAATGAVLAWCIYSLAQATALYRAGSRVMDQIIVAGGGIAPGSRLLFVNAPDRFEYRRAMYPMGYWGMLVAPVSQDLADFVAFAEGTRLETLSLSEFRLLAGQVAASPYQVNTRGVDAGPDAMYEAVAWADQVYLTDYRPGGEIEVNPVGRIASGQGDETCLAAFGDVAELCQVAASVLPDRIEVILSWGAASPGQPNDTVFMQLVDASGQWAAGADGDSLGGLIPLTTWRPGDRVLDIRRIRLPAGLAAGQYTVHIGLYNRVTGQRLPARDAAGQELPGGAYSLAVLVSP